MTWRLAAVATEAALRAGAMQKERYGQEVRIDYKGETDLVTEVDRECEAAILETIRERFPDHDIVTEETALARTGSRYLWLIDPLDGTVNFAHGYPFFCASVGVAVDGRMVAGAVYDPIKHELFTAERGAGAHLNGRRLRVSRSSDLIRSLLVTGFPYDVREDLPGKLRWFNRLMGRARAVRRDGAAALDLCYVAAGRYDAFWEERLKPWDVMAGAVCEHAVTRSVRDSAALLDATSGPDVGDPYWAPPPARPFLQEVGADPGRVRIGFSTSSATGAAIDPDCVTAVEETARLCSDLGHEVVEVIPSEIDGEAITAAFFDLWSAGQAWTMQYWSRRTGRALRADLVAEEIMQMPRQHEVEIGRDLAAEGRLLGYVHG